MTSSSDTTGEATETRCRDCGSVPGRWQPEVTARRDEMTLESCRTCGASWTGTIYERTTRDR